MIDTILTYVFGGSAAVLASLGFLLRAKRVPLWLAALFMAGATASAHYAAFWPMVSLGTAGSWAAFTALPAVDLGWRMRFGLTMSACIIAFVSLWPSLDRMSGGRFPCPKYVEDHVSFRLVAGLDLRGGLRLVYTVDVDEAIKDKRDRYYEDLRAELTRVYGINPGKDRPTEEMITKLREKVEIEVPRTSTNIIRLKVKEGTDPSKVDARLLQQFTADLGYSRSQDGRSFEFRMKETVESEIRERAVAQAREIILRRVDELGLREAAVSTRDEDVIVEVPGEDPAAFATIRDIISQTARLEFKMVDDEGDWLEQLSKTVQPESLPEGLEFLRENAPVGLDESGDKKYRTVAYAFLKKKEGETTQQALTRLRGWAATLEPPPDRELGFEVERSIDPDTLAEKETGWRTYLLKARADITGDMIRDAAAMADQGTQALGGWHVQLTFTDQGGSIFERITGANVQKRFAIILDNKVESAPVILGRIAGGSAQITMGSGDPEVQLRDARKLELVLRSGALPAPISPSNEQRIGPSLGADSIKLGVQGAIGGGCLVLLFMLLYYHRAGIIADLAVVMNLFMQLAILASFGASMTLPGIAGLALTIGMGVDANVLINERIRDELRAGKTPRAAVDIGYDRALTAIIDGHVTTLISGVILAQYGTGPVKGFAITLIVGVACSIFTGVVVSRVMFDLWVRNLARNATLDMGDTK